VLGNISSRLRVETGDNVLIGGFIITGTQDKKVVVRALGPSLSLPDKLANPTLELRDSSGGLVQLNDDWSSSPNRQAIIDSGLAPSNDLESAIIAILPANGKTYTAIARGVGGTTGTGVVEIYDVDRSVDSELANISTRGLVQTGDTILIAGTIVVGQAPQKVIVRAIGPSLNLAGKLADPTLELRDANGGLIRFDDNWRTGGQETEIMQSGAAPTNDLESALIETLAAKGAYTAIVRGVNNTAGIAVVEVYALR
jgi:pSer/pThr/pTyr-binding forkhead associated (FHA) protein